MFSKEYTRQEGRSCSVRSTPVKKAAHVQPVSLSIGVRQKIKKLYEPLMEMRNSLHMAKGSHSGG